MPKTQTTVPEPAEPPRKSGRLPDNELEDVSVEEESPKRAGPSREERDRMDGRGRSVSKGGKDRKGRKDRGRRRSPSKDGRGKHKELSKSKDRREESLDEKHGTTKCPTCGQRVGGGEHGYETHCKTSKYHMSWDFHLRGMPWNQAQARAHKIWTSWYGTPSREPREPTKLRSRERSGKHSKARRPDRSRSPAKADRSRSKAAKPRDRSRSPRAVKRDRSRSAKTEVRSRTKPKERARSSGIRRRAASATPQPAASVATPAKKKKMGETAPKAEPESSSGSYYTEESEDEAKGKATTAKPAKSAKAASTEGPSMTQLESMAQLYEANASFLRTMTGAKRWAIA